MGEIGENIRSDNFEVKINGMSVSNVEKMCTEENCSNPYSSEADKSIAPKSITIKISSVKTKCQYLDFFSPHDKKRPYREESMHPEWNENKPNLPKCHSKNKKISKSKSKDLVGNCNCSYNEIPMDIDRFYSRIKITGNTCSDMDKPW
jgi:hypothetical protein